MLCMYVCMYVSNYVLTVEESSLIREPRPPILCVSYCIILVYVCMYVAAYAPSPQEYREVFGVCFQQQRNDTLFVPSKHLTKIVVPR